MVTRRPAWPPWASTDDPINEWMDSGQDVFGADARRIVAAINDIGDPDGARRARFIREILVPRPRPRGCGYAFIPSRPGRSAEPSSTTVGPASAGGGAAVDRRKASRQPDLLGCGLGSNSRALLRRRPADGVSCRSAFCRLWSAFPTARTQRGRVGGRTRGPTGREREIPGPSPKPQRNPGGEAAEASRIMVRQGAAVADEPVGAGLTTTRPVIALMCTSQKYLKVPLCVNVNVYENGVV